MDFWYKIYSKFMLNWVIICEFLYYTLRITKIWGPKLYKSDKRIDGKIVIITGANTGIGKETALELARRGAKVIMGCRDMQKAENAAEDIRIKSPDADLIIKHLDLSSLKSVRTFANDVINEVSHIDILINNAGVMMCPEWKTADGFEMQFGTNHLGHFLLTLLLIEHLNRSPGDDPSRVINLSSIAHIRGHINFDDINMTHNYTPIDAYSQSKLANVLFTRELSKRLKYTKIKSYSVHPGIVATEIARHFNVIITFLLKTFENILLINATLGAQTTLYCTLEDSIANESGNFYKNCKRVNEVNLMRNARDDVTARRLWNLSCELTQINDKILRNE